MCKATDRDKNVEGWTKEPFELIFVPRSNVIGIEIVVILHNPLSPAEESICWRAFVCNSCNLLHF